MHRHALKLLRKNLSQMPLSILQKQTFHLSSSQQGDTKSEESPNLMNYCRHRVVDEYDKLKISQQYAAIRYSIDGMSVKQDSLSVKQDGLLGYFKQIKIPFYVQSVVFITLPFIYQWVNNESLGKKVEDLTKSQKESMDKLSNAIYEQTRAIGEQTRTIGKLADTIGEQTRTIGEMTDTMKATIKDSMNEQSNTLKTAMKESMKESMEQNNQQIVKQNQLFEQILLSLNGRAINNQKS